MYIDRTAFESDALVGDIAKLRETCMGCTNCTGICLDMLQWTQLPTIVLSRRGGKP